jgi:large conductance mechanosensitive channel
MWREFREFVNRGNVIDLAIGIIIGAAFTAIVNSLVADIVTPLLLNPAMAAANVDQLANLSYRGVKYGSFLAAVLNFLLVAFVLFLLVQAVNRFRRQEAEKPAEPAAPTNEERLLSEIRDLLRGQVTSDE